MSVFSPTLVLQTSIAKSPNDMANVQIKSEKLTPFGGIFPIMEQFDALLVSRHFRTVKPESEQIFSSRTRNTYQTFLQYSRQLFLYLYPLNLNDFLLVTLPLCISKHHPYII